MSDIAASAVGLLIGYILGVMQGRMETEAKKFMATADKEQENMPAVPACDWCRMGLHKKCIKKNLHAICVCDCERGY